MVTYFNSLPKELRDELEYYSMAKDHIAILSELFGSYGLCLLLKDYRVDYEKFAAECNSIFQKYMLQSQVSVSKTDRYVFPVIMTDHTLNFLPNHQDIMTIGSLYTLLENLLNLFANHGLVGIKVWPSIRHVLNDLLLKYNFNKQFNVMDYAITKN